MDHQASSFREWITEHLFPEGLLIHALSLHELAHAVLDRLQKRTGAALTLAIFELGEGEGQG